MEKEDQKFYNEDKDKLKIPPTTSVSQDNIYESGIFLKATANIPSGVPSSPLSKFQLYVSGATLRLYIYDTANGTWRYATLT